jgi:hypothetical protein
MAWMITVNGLIIDAPHAPRELQEGPNPSSKE